VIGIIDMIIAEIKGGSFFESAHDVGFPEYLLMLAFLGGLALLIRWIVNKNKNKGGKQ
jgi:hypothetical protein